MTYDITSFGEVGFRLSATDARSLSRAETFAIKVIGTEFNVLANLASLGWSSALLSAVPATPLGEKARATIRQLGIDDALVSSSNEDDRIGIYFVDYGVEPKPTSVYFDRKNTAFTLSNPSEQSIEKLLNTKALHLSGLTLALSRETASVSEKILKAAKDKRVMVSFDLNYRRKLWDKVQAYETCLPYLQQADLIIAPNEDINELFDRTETAQTNLEFLAENFDAQTIAVTDGERGAVARIEGNFYHEPAAKVTIIDRLGAGDGFAAGFLHATLAGTPEVALSSGVNFAALALSQYGEQVAISKTIFDQIVAGNAGRLNR